jgi:hypothetical protein
LSDARISATGMQHARKKSHLLSAILGRGR